MTDDKQGKLYKTSGAFEHELKNDLEMNMDKFKDPLILGELMYKLLEERENTNRILKNILAKLEAMEAKETTGQRTGHEEILLPEVDEEILNYVIQQSKATAEHVRAHFRY